MLESQHVEITRDVAEDLEMKALADKCVAKVGAAMDVVIGETAIDLDARFQSIRTKETNIGNFVTDVMRHQLHADLAVLNSGTLRADAVMEAGVLKMKDLVNLLPMLDELCLLEITGAQILSVLENSVSQYPRLEGRFAQVSGIRFSFDPTKPGGTRVVDGSVTLDGKPLGLASSYKLVTKDYLRQGKDGFDVFKECRCLADGEQAGILPTMVREHFECLRTLNGLTENAHAHATKRAAHMLEEGGLVKTGSGPDLLKQYAISPEVEGRIICLG